VNGPTTWRAVRRYWAALILGLLTCLAGAVTYTRLSDPVYTASADILVSPVRLDRAVSGSGVVVESAEPVRAVQTAAAVLENEDAAFGTAVTMGEEWTPDRVAQAISVAARGQSNLVSVEARANSPLTASLLATTYANEAVTTRNADVRERSFGLLNEYRLATEPNVASGFDREVAELLLLVQHGDPSVSVIEDAPVPISPSSPPDLLVYLVAALAGLVGGLGLALLLNALTEREPGDAELAATQSTTTPISVFRLPQPEHRSVPDASGDH